MSLNMHTSPFFFNFSFNYIILFFNDMDTLDFLHYIYIIIYFILVVEFVLILKYTYLFISCMRESGPSVCNELLSGN